MKKFILLVFSLFSFVLIAAEFTGIHRSVPAGSLQIHQVYLGYQVGDAYFLQLPDGKTVMVDTGMINCVDDYLLPAMERLKLRKIDTVIITHFHNDHVSGLLTMLSDPGIEIGQIMYSSMPYEEIPGEYTKKIFSTVLRMAEVKNIPVRKLEVGDKLDFGCGVTAVVSGAALSGSKDKNLNSHSLVFQLKYGDFTALFTGDCSMQQEPRVLASGMPVKSDLLKMGHHAGANSTSDRFLDAVAPKAAIASMPSWLSRDKRGKRVEAMLKKRNIPLFRSWEYPELVVFSDGKSFGICLSPKNK